MATAYAAVDNGADAVYVGISLNNMTDRLRSDLGYRGGIACYSPDRICKILAYCNRHSVALHVALNNLYTDYQREEARRTMEILADIGVSTVVIADPAFMKWVSTNYPQVVIHASVVAGTVNHHTANYYRELGARVITVENSLTREGLALVRKNVDMEICIFVYGITCFCFYGTCQLSPYVNGISCVAPCNRKVTVQYPEGGETGHFLRARDLDLLNDIPELAKMGIDYLKVEGRMRSTRYVATSTAAVRYVLDAWKDGRDIELPRRLRRKLGTLPFFGTSRGYFGSGTPEDKALAVGGVSLRNKVLEYGAVRNPKLTVYLTKRRLVGSPGRTGPDSYREEARGGKRLAASLVSDAGRPPPEIVIETSLAEPVIPTGVDRISVGEKHCAFRFLKHAAKIRDIAARITDAGAVPTVTTPSRLTEDFFDRIFRTVVALKDVIGRVCCYDPGLARALSPHMTVTLLANCFGPEGAEFAASSVGASGLRPCAGSVVRYLKQGFPSVCQEVQVFGRLPLMGGIYCNSRRKGECPNCSAQGYPAVRDDGIGLRLVGNTVYSEKMVSAHLIREQVVALPFAGLVIETQGQSLDVVQRVVDFYRGESEWPALDESTLCNGMYLADPGDRQSRPVPWHAHVPDLRHQIFGT